MENVLIIGAARSGIAAAKLLLSHGYEITLTDMGKIENKQELEQSGIHVFDFGHPEHLKHANWSFIVKNPGINYRVPFVKYFVDQGIQILTEVEIGYRYAKRFQYGAVTGTNGKTTITSLLYEMLKKNHKAIVAGNIGFPLSELAYLYEDKEKDVALELSNFQLLGIDTFRPQVSVVCNLAPDHLDYMGSIEAYYQSKMNIYKNCRKEDWFLRNVDDERVLRYARNIPCQVIDFSLKRQDTALHRRNGSVYLNDLLLFEESSLKIVGEYNVCNAMIAACMAYKLHVSIPDIQDVIANFKSVEHRLEYVGEARGIQFYNDSKATNTHAVTAALKSFEKPVILLAGGHDKGISFDDLKVFDSNIKCCIAYGETKEKFKEIFTNVIVKETLEDAFREAVKCGEAGDVILLSPACSSYDQFHSYEERGDQFKQMVLSHIDDSIA